MNYRHDYHAGNFADVVKHVVLARILTYMKLKPRPFRVIDTHAGAGRYDLEGPEAAKTGEWRDGIARLFEADLPAPVADLMAPYLDAVRAVNAPGELRYYPGSPLIARLLMRSDDVLVANELNTTEFARLKTEVRHFGSTSVLNIDAWRAVKSLLPPVERRGIVLIDPPFEEKSEFADIARAIAEAMARFATGVYLIWYPLKDVAVADRFLGEIITRSNLEYLDVRLAVCRSFAGLGLTAAGVLVLNPPHVLKEELAVITPVLGDLLQQGEGSSYRLHDSVP